MRHDPAAHGRPGPRRFGLELGTTLGSWRGKSWAWATRLTGR